MYQNGVLTMTGIGGPPPRPRAEPVPVCGHLRCVRLRARGPQRVSRAPGGCQKGAAAWPSACITLSTSVRQMNRLFSTRIFTRRAAPVIRLVEVEPLAAFASGESKALMLAHEVPAAFRSGARTRRRRRHNHQHLAARSCQLHFARPAMRRHVHARNRIWASDYCG